MAMDVRHAIARAITHAVTLPHSHRHSHCHEHCHSHCHSPRELAGPVSNRHSRCHSLVTPTGPLTAHRSQVTGTSHFANDLALDSLDAVSVRCLRCEPSHEQQLGVGMLYVPAVDGGGRCCHGWAVIVVVLVLVVVVAVATVVVVSFGGEWRAGEWWRRWWCDNE
jgi:hypothetical protein